MPESVSYLYGIGAIHGCPITKVAARYGATAAPFRSVPPYFKHFMSDKNHKNECWQKINFELLVPVAVLATFMR